MSAAPRVVPMRAAKRPESRTVEIELGGDFEGWRATVRGDFRAGLLADLQSGELVRIMAVLDAIILAHNFPDESGDVAATMADVEPYDGLIAAGTAIFEGLGKLPNRSGRP